MRLSDEAGYQATREAVRPELSELARHVAARGGPATWPLAVPFGDESLLLSKLGQELVTAFSQPADPDAAEWRELTALALGLQAKILAALGRLAETTDRDTQRSAVSSLADDAIRGSQLAFALHSEVNTLTRAGRLNEARELADTRLKLLERVGAARRVASPDASSDRQAAISASTPPPPLQDFDLDVALTTRRPKLPAPPPRREVTRPNPPVKAAPTPPKRSRRPWQAPLAATLVVVLAAVIGLQLRGCGNEAGTLSATDLATVPGFLQAIHRPPTVLVVVDQDTWNHTPVEARRSAVETVGRIADAEGYDVAELRSPGAQGLAWWRRGKGVSLPP